MAHRSSGLVVDHCLLVSPLVLQIFQLFSTVRVHLRLMLRELLQEVSNVQSDSLLNIVGSWRHSQLRESRYPLWGDLECLEPPQLLALLVYSAEGSTVLMFQIPHLFVGKLRLVGERISRVHLVHLRYCIIGRHHTFSCNFLVLTCNRKQPTIIISQIGVDTSIIWRGTSNFLLWRRSWCRRWGSFHFREHRLYKSSGKVNG